MTKPSDKIDTLTTPHGLEVGDTLQVPPEHQLDFFHGARVLDVTANELDLDESRMPSSMVIAIENIDNGLWARLQFCAEFSYNMLFKRRLVIRFGLPVARILNRSVTDYLAKLGQK